MVLLDPKHFGSLGATIELFLTLPMFQELSPDAGEFLEAVASSHKASMRITFIGGILPSPTPRKRPTNSAFSPDIETTDRGDFGTTPRSPAPQGSSIVSSPQHN